ncbi:MAG TPA: hypothetical protein VFU47_03350, partial [Armatimonadota bacterium]|nr:hypothetical protein [Armatimonadota bacterium]
QVLIQRRFYLYHWMMFTPPAAIVTGHLLWRAWNAAAPRGDIVRRASLIAAVTGGAWALLSLRAELYRNSLAVLAGRWDLREYQRSFRAVFDYSVGDGMDAGLHVRSRSTPRDRLLVLGFEPHVYFYAQRTAPTRHASTAPLFGETSISEARRERWFAEYMGDLRGSPPLYWVEREGEQTLSLPPWAAELPRFRFQHYRLEGKYGRFRVYRRRDAPRSPRPRN